MFFCNEYSKFNTGDCVVFKTTEKTKPIKIVDVGILGGKLSGWKFLYTCQDENGEEFQTFEDYLF